MSDFKFNSQSAQPRADVVVDGPGPLPVNRNTLHVVAKPAAEPADNQEVLTIDGVVFPREASAHIRAMSPAERADWDEARFKCKTDQLYLSEVLGLDLVENPHRALFDTFLKKRPGVPIAELDPTIKRRMVLWPRGHGKTVALRVEMVQLFLNYPDARLCFLTGGDQLAKRQLTALKQVFEKPKPKFLELFPEFCLTSHQNKKTHQWIDALDELGTQHEFTLPCRTSTIFAEPSFAITTSRAVKAGSHFDFLFVDDLVNENNFRNAKALDKCYEDYLSLVPLLDPAGYLTLTGTRYAFDDAYARIIDAAKAAGESSLWSFSIRNCWSTGCTNCEHAEVFHDRNVNILQPPCNKAGCCAGFVSDGVRGVLFPQLKTRDGRLFGFTLDILEKIKSEVGPKFFANQYENCPVAADAQVFTEALIGSATIFDIAQVPNYFTAPLTFAVGDLADSEDEERDASVIYLCRKHQGRLYVFDCLFGRWGSAELVDNVVKMMMDSNRRPAVVYFEKTLGSGHLHDLIIARANSLGLPKVPIQWIKTGNRKGMKSLRIGNIQEALKSKRLFLFAGMPGYDLLVSQLLKFPRVKHDDFADCLGRVVEAPTGYEQETPPQRQSVSHWLAKLHGSAPVDESYPDSGGGNGLCCGG